MGEAGDSWCGLIPWDGERVYFIRPPLLALTGAPSAMDIARNIGNAFTDELIELAKNDLPVEYTQHQLANSVRFHVERFFSDDLLFYILDEMRTIWTARRRAACIQAVAADEEPYFFPAELLSAPNKPDYLDRHVAAYFNGWLTKHNIYVDTGIKIAKNDVTVSIRDRINDIRNAVDCIANDFFSKECDYHGRGAWSYMRHHTADVVCARILAE